MKKVKNVILFLLLGMNKPPEDSPHNPLQCTFNSPTFIIYSSIFSFYIPAIVMLSLYYKIFSVIRSRAKKAKKRKPKIDKSKNETSMCETIANFILPKRKNLEVENINKLTSLQLQTTASNVFPTKTETNGTLQVELITTKTNLLPPSVQNDKIEKLNDNKKKMTSSFVAGQSNSNNKERKVTKTLAIVVCFFLSCW
jgi:hypothetical protein